ncbi:uncharacterized protein LOC128676977 isoform X2 [Plodia interpunctella]|uniref:uncharacterized protein LOC128676977 isoform X2 n=1 Tax=Plodia interpunctella TaxID=58824 RepID=UPI00236861EA|nr:uncharacterized protein LOC128676977 isoform X2 [Plodia interpunctella]
MTTVAKHHRSWPYHTLFCIPVLSAEIDTRILDVPELRYKWLYKRKTAAYKMRLTGSRTYTRPAPVPKMPTGLIELMEDLTRDVLKNNPSDVYEFCADHMRKLLDIRDGPSLKRPLTLEEKIARAQKIVKKRGDARWQRYLQEKKNNSKVQSAPENIDETKAKPPVYPDLNIEKTSEIEICHEPGSDNDFSEDPNVKYNTSNTEVNPQFLDNTHISTTNGTIDPNSSLISQHLDNVTETDSNDVSKNDQPNFNLTTETMANVQNLQNPLLIDNKSTIDAIHDGLSNATEVSNLKDEVNENVDGKLTHETAPAIEVSEQEIGYQGNNSLTDMGKVVNTAVGLYNIVNDSARSPIHKAETLVNDDIDILKTQDKTTFQSDVDEIKEIIDSKIVSTQQSDPIDKETENKSDQENEHQASIADMGKLINTTIGVLNVINSQNSDTPDGINDLNNIGTQLTQGKNIDQRDIHEVKEKQLILLQGTAPSDKEIVKTFEQEPEVQAIYSLAEMGNVNTAIGVLNNINDSSIRIAEDIEDINDNYDLDLLKTQDEEPFQTHVEQTDISFKNTIPLYTDADKKLNLEIEHSDCAMTNDNILKNIQGPVTESSLKDIQVDGNATNKDNASVPFIEKDLKNGEKIILDDSHITDGIKTSQNGNNGLESTIVHDIRLENLNSKKLTIDSGVASSHEVFIQSLTNDKKIDASLVPDVVRISGSAEPLVNAVIIKTSSVEEEPTEGNIIEIRISQVAEALNNEVPITMNIIKTSETSDLPFNSVDMHTEEENGVQVHSIPEDIDYESSVTSINLDDIQNTNITSVLKSASIDESTDGMDNTSLIESATSDTTDDIILNNANNSTMDLETAAVTIQKVFRSFMFKSRASTFDDNDENISLDEENKKDEPEFQITNINKERRGISRMDTVLQTVNEEKSLSLSTDDSSTLSSAATIIQAHVRGFLVRNKLHSNRTASTSSQLNSDGHDGGDVDHKNNKTILNIHIVPEGGNYLSRDESMLTSMDFSLDGSPPSSLNLHPLGYDKNERRKLKREDAVQSISPPSNNSGKLSEDVDSVKDMLITDHQTDQKDDKDEITKNDNINNRPGSVDTSPTTSLTIETVIEAHKLMNQESSDADSEVPIKNVKGTLTKQSSDEMDVVTPFEDKITLADSTSTSKLLHSGEFHDVVLPTKVSRGETSVVSGE